MTANAALNLRERRRIRTQRMIQGEALRLFAEKGYQHTTVDDIADAAAISPRTFFRYFATKEHVVSWTECGAVALELLEARPDDESPAEAIRQAIHGATVWSDRHDRERVLARARLTSSFPEVRARVMESMFAISDLLASRLAAKRGATVDDLGLRVIVAAVLAAWRVALDRWEQDDGKSDLVVLFDEAIDALVDSADGLRPAP